MPHTLILLLLVGFAFATAANAQPTTTVEEYRLQQEQYKRTLLTQQLDSGVYLMDTEQYLLADAKFKYVLQHVKSVPSDLTFYFGKNSYFLKQYKQSIDWLNKYLQLKGTNGRFSEEAASVLGKAEKELVSQKMKESKASEELLSRNFDIDCGPSGKVLCPVCKGEHVVIKKGSFGSEYKTCSYCNEHGILTCDEYNLLLRGELKPRF